MANWRSSRSLFIRITAIRSEAVVCQRAFTEQWKVLGESFAHQPVIPLCIWMAARLRGGGGNRRGTFSNQIYGASIRDSSETVKEQTNGELSKGWVTDKVQLVFHPLINGLIELERRILKYRCPGDWQSNCNDWAVVCGKKGTFLGLPILLIQFTLYCRYHAFHLNELTLFLAENAKELPPIESNRPNEMQSPLHFV